MPDTVGALPVNRFRIGPPEPKNRRPGAGWSGQDQVRLPSVTDRVFDEPPRVIVTLSLSPGLCESMIDRRLSADLIVVPSSAVITSPALIPADAAALPELTSRTAMPFRVVWTLTPSSACCAEPLVISCATIVAMVFDGIAKPTPSFPPESLWLCLVIPITL